LLPFIQNDRLGKSVLRAHSVAIPKELQKSQTALKHRSSTIAQRRSTDCHGPIDSPVSDTALIRATHLPGVFPLQAPLQVNTLFMQQIISPGKLQRRPYQHRNE
jgi:hypothetical protein